jgi:cardiolipin synthase A/B
MSSPKAHSVKRRGRRQLRRDSTWWRLQIAVRRAVGLISREGRRARRARQHTDIGLARHWERMARSLLPLGATTAGNLVTIYCDGDTRLDDMWACIAGATRSIWLEIYTLAPDRVGSRTVEELTRAAERGCEVLLLYDAVGSSSLTESLLRPLREAGAEIAVFNPLLAWRRKAPLLRRDHRKILIVDGRIGFCGGMNISEDYAGRRHGNGLFRDCHARLEGPCVRDLAAVLASSWRMVTHRRKPLPNRAPEAGDTLLQVLASRGVQGRRAIQRSVRFTVHNALRRCYITTPYFVPPLRLIHAMTRAAQRGVDVRVLTAGKCDVPIVKLAAQHIYGRLLRQGVRIFEIYDCTLHAKTIAIDGLYCTIGSFNLDQWSHKRNLEVNVGILDPRVTGEVERDLLSNLKTAKEVTLETWQKRTWWRRLLHWAAYQLLRV